MKALRAAWRWVSGVPKWVKIGAAALALSGSLYAGWLRVVHTIRAEEAARIYAKADSVRASSLDSLRLALVDSLRTVSKEAAKRGTVVRRSVSKVREKVRTLPPSVAEIPEVKELSDASLDLANDAERMAETLRKMTGLTERFIVADSAQIQVLTVTVVKYQDRVVQLEKRPAWWKVALGGIATGAIGFVIGSVTR